MNYKKFKNGDEMFGYITSGNDLYSKSAGIYVFVYNDADALCYYSLGPEAVIELLKEREESWFPEEYWGAFLGWGGAILDDGEYDDDDEYRYSEDWEKRKLYLQPSLDFCNEMFATEDWLDTDDVTIEYLMSE